MIIALVALLLMLVIAAVAVSLAITYRNLVRLKNDIDKAWASLDVLLKQRTDELPKLIETCKGYMWDEPKALQMIVEARKAYQKAGTTQEKAQGDAMLAGALKNLFAVAGNYPELKTNRSFVQLRGHMADLGEKIAERREFFNHSAETYNTQIGHIPGAFVARFMNLPAKQLFQVVAADRQDAPAKPA
jgi:LemA protein